MRKKLIMLVLFGLFAAMVFAASITSVQAGLITSNPDPQKAKPGDTITVTYTFTPSGFDEWFGVVQGSRLAPGTYDRIRVQWYSAANGTGTTSYVDIDANQFEDPSIINDETNQKSLTFVLPTPPSNRLSFRIRSALYGDDGDFNEVGSSAVLSSGVSGTYGYIEVDLNTAPTATVQIDNPSFTKIGQTLVGSYVYSDADGDPEGASQMVWLRSTTADPNGAYVSISGATGSTYTLGSHDLGRFIKFQVTPIAQQGVLQGTTVQSAASDQVFEASSIALDPSSPILYEAGANDGSVAGFIRIKLTNGDFVPSVTTVNIANLPAGLSVGSIVRISDQVIRVYLSGAALSHEHASSILNDYTLLVTVPANQIVAQNIDLETSTGFQIDFANNPVNSFARSSVGNNYVSIGWSMPSGLKDPSALLSFNIYRNGSFLDQVAYSASQSSYTFKDTGLTNGVAYAYNIVADYNNPGVSEDPSSIEVVATPMAISAYSFQDLDTIGTIDQDAKTISLEVPAITDLSALIATFSATAGITVNVNGTPQTSGSTPNNFTDPVQYVLSAVNGSSSTYTVTVTKTPYPLDAPELTEGNVTTSSLQFTWDAIDGALEYSMDLSTDSEFGSFVDGYHDLEISASLSSYTINGMDANTSYYIRMRALHANPLLHSAYSTTLNSQTLSTGNGTGSTEIIGNEPTVVNIGQYHDEVWGYTINPAMTLDPISFSPGGNNVVEVSLSIGAAPEGLRYLMDFDNATIGIGTFTMSYDGLPYDPTDLGFRINGGGLVSLGGTGINTENKTITISVDALKKGQKGIYALELITNDASGETLPVVLSSFTANIVSGSKVRINWVTQSESDLQGFYILRGTTADLDQAISVSPLIAATNTSNQASYTYTDSEVPGPGVYYYWLMIQDMDGSATYTNSILVTVGPGGEEIPEVIRFTSLKNAYPNPFNPTITIAYDIASPGHVSMEVYNTRGQKIRTLVSEVQDASSYQVRWDGRDANGRAVASGNYLVKMRTKGYDTTRKITLMK